MTHQPQPSAVHDGAPARPARLHRLALAGVLASGALLAATSAQSAVSSPGGSDARGSLAGITYGAGGSFFQFDPLLFVQGLGSATDAQTVAGRSADLQYSASILGDGTGLMTIEYLLRNTSASQSFSQLRFVAFANPDGAGDFLDQLSENWGVAAAGDPVLREGRAFIDPVSGINVGFSDNGTLTEGVLALDAACTAAAGCDATVGLQWNATTLAPGETFRIRVGLSDDGRALSGRFLNVASVSDPATMLTFSGQGAIVPVPEPGISWMLAAGLVGLGFIARRRQPN